MLRWSRVVQKGVSVLRSFSGLSSEQIQFQSLAQDFAKTELLPYGLQWEQEKRFSIPTMQRAAKLGFSGICVDPEMGGCGLGALDAAIVFEALAYGDVSTTAFLTVQNMVATIIDICGTREQRMRYLPKLMTLECFGSYCLTEPESGSDAASLTTTARTDTINGKPSYVLKGSKAFISGAGLSDVYLVMARTGGQGASGVSAFLVEKDTEGVQFGKEEAKMGWISQPTASVFFQDAIIPSENLVGEEGTGFRIGMKALDRGRVNIAACAVGGAQYCLEAAETYTNSRRQFGKSISSFQNTQFTLAEISTRIQSARLMVHHAARSIDHDDPSATVDAAMAKMYATDMAVDVSNRSLQLFGGYGYLKEYNVERYVRDLRVMTILEGTNEIMKVIIHKGRHSDRTL